MSSQYPQDPGEQESTPPADAAPQDPGGQPSGGPSGPFEPPTIHFGEDQQEQATPTGQHAADDPPPGDATPGQAFQPPTVHLGDEQSVDRSAQPSEPAPPDQPVGGTAPPGGGPASAPVGEPAPWLAGQPGGPPPPGAPPQGSMAHGNALHPGAAAPYPGNHQLRAPMPQPTRPPGDQPAPGVQRPAGQAGGPPPAQQAPPGRGAPAAPTKPPSPQWQALSEVRGEIGKVIVGQEAIVTGAMIALLCKGHVLLEGVPGVAKTLLVRALAGTLDLQMKRVQFTPDLMPGDVTGSLVYDTHTAEFEFREGPVFTNLLLADEINRTPPKTQAALLEAMEERQVTVEGEPRALPAPFLVAATQNPVEYEGTYPLPEAQLDRFLLKLNVLLPSRAEEIDVITRHASGFDPRDLDAVGLRRIAGPDELAAGQREVRKVTVRPEVIGYVVDICRATRQSPSLQLGASPRGATALLAAARAWSWLAGRDYVTPDDVKSLSRPTLRHRVQLRPEAELEGVTSDSVLDGILATVPVPR